MGGSRSKAGQLIAHGWLLNKPNSRSMQLSVFLFGICNHHLPADEPSKITWTGNNLLKTIHQRINKPRVIYCTFSTAWINIEWIYHYGGSNRPRIIYCAANWWQSQFISPSLVFNLLPGFASDSLELLAGWINWKSLGGDHAPRKSGFKWAMAVWGLAYTFK